MIKTLTDLPGATENTIAFQDPTTPRDADSSTKRLPYIYFDHEAAPLFPSLRIPNLGYYPRKRVEVEQVFPLDALVLVLQGTGMIWTKPQQAVAVKAPLYFFVRAKERGHYTPEMPNGWEERFISFEGPRVQDWSYLNWLSPYGVIRPLDNPTRFAERHEAIAQDYISKDPLRMIRACLEAERMIFDLHLGNAADQGRKDFDPLDEILRQWRENPVQAVTGPEAAKSVGMSYSNFRARFSEKFGMSPGRRLLTLRTTLACELLGTTERSVKDIAYEVGFTHIESFNRAFKRLKGLSPTEYRDRKLVL